MQYPRICSAEAIDDFTLRVEFSNQEIKTYDIHKLLDKPMFFPLKNPAFFRNFRIEEGGYAIVWNREVDLSEYELWKNGQDVEKNVPGSHVLSESTLSEAPASL